MMKQIRNIFFSLAALVFGNTVAVLIDPERCPDGGQVALKQFAAEVTVLEPYSVANETYARALNESREKRMKYLQTILERWFGTVDIVPEQVKDCWFEKAPCPLGMKLLPIKDLRLPLVQIAARVATNLMLAGAHFVLDNTVSGPKSLSTKPAVRLIMLIADNVSIKELDVQEHEKAPYWRHLPTSEQLQKALKEKQADIILFTPLDQARDRWTKHFNPQNVIYDPNANFLKLAEGFEYDTLNAKIVHLAFKKLSEAACSSLLSRGMNAARRSIENAVGGEEFAVLETTAEPPAVTATTTSFQKTTGAKACVVEAYPSLRAVDLNLVWIKPRTLRKIQARKFNSPPLKPLRFAREIRRGFKTSAVHMVEVTDDSTDSRSCLKTLRSAASLAKFSKGPLVKSTLLAATLAEIYFKAPSATTRIAATSASKRQVLNLVLVFANGWGKKGTKKLVFNVEGPNTCKSDYPSLREVQQRLSKQNVHLLLVTTNKALQRSWSTVFKAENSLLLPKRISTTPSSNCKRSPSVVARFVKERAAAAAVLSRTQLAQNTAMAESPKT